ncbi:RagB/SusD family nutrient uptake outer membrane protein [Aquimarina addita]|uniref:RagB/SusD family nutrient uptake outer membrane protein n=1 Tax=Aquimarina addita TaxID=870485 RepID=A0ABP6UTD5_9FLAO
MKKLIKLFVLFGVLASCSDELDVPQQGSISADAIVFDAAWINTQIVAAYGILDGNLDNTDVWRAAASNWIYGEVASDNAYKGSEPGDAAPINNVEKYTPLSTSAYLDYKWRAVFEGIARCNSALIAIEKGLLTEDLNEEDATVLQAEARFLRGHFHFEAKKMWNNIPFIDETVTESQPNVDIDSWSRIEEDFAFAAANLGENAADMGRVNSWTAKSYLAKIHMYQSDFAAAKPILNDVINNGPYALNAFYSDNFNFETSNSAESVFAVQHAADDESSNGSTGNWGEALNFPQTSDIGSGCCGFFQPSQNLVNAFKTDADGLPLLDTFNDVDVTNDQGISSDDPFTPYTGNLDPRLDWTVGRRGIDFQGWDVHPGQRWIRDPNNGGPYLQKKTVYRKSQAGTANSTSAWTLSVSAININIIRYSEVLLWAAEVAAEESDLATALIYVNQVRNRASNPDDFVKEINRIVDPETNAVTLEVLETPAANYVIEEYPSFPDKEYALKAINFERRIELAMEGHRFFDLVRQGRAQSELNTYLSVESTKRVHLSGASFGAGDEYYPIPQTAIDLSGGVLEQN